MIKTIVLCLLLPLTFVSQSAELNSNQASVKSSDSKYQAGIHYDVLTPGMSLTSDEPVVYEFFGYTCPGCNAMQPIVKELEGKTNFKLVRVPVVLDKSWEPYAKTFHTLEVMNLTDKTHQAIFNAIHVSQKKMRNTAQIADWLAATFAIDKDEFLSLSQSFVVDGKMRKAEQLRQSLHVTTTPTLIINGKYKPNISRLADRENIVAAMDSLLKK